MDGSDSAGSQQHQGHSTIDHVMGTADPPSPKQEAALADKASPPPAFQDVRPLGLATPSPPAASPSFSPSQVATRESANEEHRVPSNGDTLPDSDTDKD